MIVRVIADTTRAKGIDDVGAKTGKFSRGLATASKVATGALIAVGGAAIGAAKAAAEDQASQDALAKSMVKNADASKTQIAATEDWISKMSAATGVADDELRPALSTLVRATGDVEKSQKALAIAMDVSAATGKPLKSVSDAMAKGFAGSTTSLGRLVPGLSKAALASGDMGRVMDELKAKTGGAAKAAGETAAGKMKRFQLALSETQEAAGAALLPAMSKLANVLLKVGNWAQKHGTMFTIIAGGVAILAGAIIALNIAMTAYTAVTTLAAAASEAAWIAALGPIGLIIIAVGAVVAAIVILWKKSETFRSIVLGVWRAIKVAASAVARSVKAVWQAVFSALSAYVRAYLTAFKVAFAVIRTVARAVGDAAKAIWRGVWSVLSGLVRAYVSTFRSIFEGVRSAASNVASAVRSAWSNVWSALKSAASGIGAVISAPFETIKRAIDAVISAVESLIGWLGKIHVPKISLPHIPGLGRAAPTVSAGATGFGAYAAPRVRGPGGRAAGTSGGVVINVNGALDPERVARQIGRIMDGHDRRVRGRAL